MALKVDPVQGAGGRHVPRRGPASFADAGYCGRSFNEGVLRFHDAQTGPNYRELCFEAFPELATVDADADVLAFDWHGRQYVTAAVAGTPDVQVLILDVCAGTIERLAGVAEFAAVLKLDNMRDFFDGDFYDQWRAAVGRPDGQLGFSDCVEFTVPLYLGGPETVENLQLIDLDVSWTIGAQLRAQTPRS
ncbi:MAG: hypothetical protein QM779_07430 [Propionicimonas sp.]|uniref:hypothetical protein n=1 Tax=Propionicimonas sp. TaxID=1955623 RepID=UPI003D0B7A02